MSKEITIEKISVPGLQGEDSVIDFNWQFNGGSSPSKLSVTIANKNGTYSPQEPDFSKEEDIKVGEFTFKGYLLSTEFDSTVDQKVLRLEYVDKSIKLDQWFVGLNTIHGKRKSGASNPKNLILVGKQYHPCDKNLDSIVDYTETKVQIDPCDPCPFMPPTKYQSICDAETTNWENYPVYYTFHDLITQIQNKISELKITFDASKIYLHKAQHVGSLRTVLNSWMDDLGLVFYYDATADELKFIDRTALVTNFKLTTYDQVKKIPNVTDIKYKTTLEGTYSRGFIGSYRKPGGPRSYSCENDTYQNLKPLTFSELTNFDAKQNSSAQSNDKIKSDLMAKEIGVVLNYYSVDLRNSFFWFAYYGILDHKILNEKYKTSSSSSSSSGSSSSSSSSSSPSSSSSANPPSSSPSGQPSGGGSNNASNTRTPGNNITTSDMQVDASYFKSEPDEYEEDKNRETESPDKKLLQFFGDMEVYDVFHPKLTGEQKNKFFTIRDTLMTRQQKEFYMLGGGTPDDPKYYFFIAKVNEDSWSQMVETEQNLANNFLGKHFYRLFSTNVPNSSNALSECSVEGPPEDGSGNFVKTGQNMTNLNIFNFGHTPKSTLGRFVKAKFNSGLADNIRLRNQRANTMQKTVKEKKPELYATKGFLLWEKANTKWFPELDFASKWYQTLFNWHGDQCFKKYGTVDGRPEILFTLYPAAKWDTRIKLFIVKELKDWKLGLELQDEHPLQEPAENHYLEKQSADGKTVLVNRGRWGLQSTSCIQISVPGMVIFPPVQCFSEQTQDMAQAYTKQANLSEPNPSFLNANYQKGFRVFVKCSDDIPVFIPKIELINSVSAKDPEKVSSVDYFISDITENFLNLFGGSCIPNEQLLQAYVKDLANMQSYSYSKPLKIISFKLAGLIPEQFKVEEGLSSLSLIISSEGVFTQYEFSDKLFQPPGINISLSNLENKYIKPVSMGGGVGQSSNYQILKDLHTRTSQNTQKTTVL